MQGEKDYLLHLWLSPRKFLEDNHEKTFQRGGGMYMNMRKPKERKNEELEKNEGS